MEPQPRPLGLALLLIILVFCSGILGEISNSGKKIDFSKCLKDEKSGLCCLEKTETRIEVRRQSQLECVHKNTEQCHYTYVTKFQPTQEEVCEESFEKQCHILFQQQAVNETVRKCYRPTEKVCNGEGEEVCRTVHESSCTTSYVEKQPGKFVADTRCEKLPVEVCGAGCIFGEGEEECHDKVVGSLLDVPVEMCDLSPHKNCRFVTKLVPRLTPEEQCTIVPRESCHLKPATPIRVPRQFTTRWCLDSVTPGETGPGIGPDVGPPEIPITDINIGVGPGAVQRPDNIRTPRHTGTLWDTIRTRRNTSEKTRSWISNRRFVTRRV